MEELIQILGLKKSFHGVPVLRGLNLNVNTSQLTVLIGPSGCGKSTLLRCINGLESFDEGMIRLDGITLRRDSNHVLSPREFHRQAHEMRSMVGMVFQSFNLFPHMTALENVARPPIIVQGVPNEEARSRASELLKKVGLQDKSGHYPAQLSGGQQQRAAIARALAMRPRVILYDEPTSALDPTLADEVLQVMKELDREGITQIVVTHEMRFAREAADKIVFIDNGTVVEEGKDDSLFVAPVDPRTRQFLKHYL